MLFSSFFGWHVVIELVTQYVTAQNQTTLPQKMKLKNTETVNLIVAINTTSTCTYNIHQLKV